MKKVLIVLCAMILFASYSVQSFAVTFSDVADNAWFKDYVYNLANNGVINGYPDGTFKPDGKVTVGEFLKLIITASEPDLNFDLVGASYDHWASRYLTVAENMEVVEPFEYAEEDFDREITRIELVRLLTKCDVLIKETPQQASSKTFTDTKDTDEEDLFYLSHAVAIGVISGDPAGTFRPNDSLKRSECAKVIYTYTNR